MDVSKTDRPKSLRHRHFWGRPLSRREFIGAGIISAGAAATAGLWMPAVALAGDQVATVPPQPIPGGVSPFGIFIHHFPPAPGVVNEPSQITDFNGFVGICRVRGKGTGTDLATGIQTRLNYQVDNGFMDGVYVGVDGKDHRGTFAFV
jgi:hypothetical protein